MRIFVGSDHAGFELKEAVKNYLVQVGHEVQDQGVFSTDSSDYPEQAAAVANGVSRGQAERGVLVCGSGVGMSVTANRFQGVRAVLASSAEYARMARRHNDSNLLCLGQRFTPEKEAMEILDVFLAEPFEGGRHARRVAKIDAVAGA